MNDHEDENSEADDDKSQLARSCAPDSVRCSKDGRVVNAGMNFYVNLFAGEQFVFHMLMDTLVIFN